MLSLSRNTSRFARSQAEFLGRCIGHAFGAGQAVEEEEVAGLEFGHQEFHGLLVLGQERALHGCSRPRRRARSRGRRSGRSGSPWASYRSGACRAPVCRSCRGTPWAGGAGARGSFCFASSATFRDCGSPGMTAKVMLAGSAAISRAGFRSCPRSSITMATIAFRSGPGSTGLALFLFLDVPSVSVGPSFLSALSGVFFFLGLSFSACSGRSAVSSAPAERPFLP